ncbi:hypothetical protein ASPZODRAFT_17491 [Penicilliopsis zonata CBS 506.65]|uniref:Uncharacterized protein n=1 Tax=Penicilliopsis zonata CBS 506.65 TaxID=1073090 RepID=A0A1L9SDQ5_9EURO|nr:hypothetical protein ASPZODRAFT_17491 [Penicilliopsis zonata CBS 506.65]OJJ45272.1 hypothetical protein ASPZODRAFT_17491 [Penicilliopsis zonata CBS 506.65]
MPMTWDSTADAKLLLAILDQMRTSQMKLDYKEIAAYMGPAEGDEKPVPAPPKRKPGRPPKAAKKVKAEEDEE